MTQTVNTRRLAAVLLTTTLVAAGSAANAQESSTQGTGQTQTQSQEQAAEPSRNSTFLDLEAGLGFASNPDLRVNGESSAFGRLSASGYHAWSSETGVISLRGYLENTTYFKRYGSKQLFSLGAATTQQLSPTVTVFGDLGFSGDFGGQLSNRFFYNPGDPVLPDPTNPLPDPVVNPDLFGINGRQYRVSGSAGASIRSGPRSTISLTAGASHSFSSGDNKDADYTGYFGSGAYSRQISERTNAGASISVARQDFKRGGSSTTVNPAVFANTQLSEQLSAEGSIGVMRINQDFDGHSDSSTALSFSGSLCNVTTSSRFCGRVSRDATTGLTSAVLGGETQAAITTSASLSYSRKLSANDSIQASVSASRYSTAASIEGLDDPESTYVSGVIGYDRNIGARLFGGVQGGVRKLFQTGPDSDIDFNATVYLRYRLGDL